MFSTGSSGNTKSAGRASQVMVGVVALGGVCICTIGLLSTRGVLRDRTMNLSVSNLVIALGSDAYSVMTMRRSPFKMRSLWPKYSKSAILMTVELWQSNSKTADLAG